MDKLEKVINGLECCATNRRRREYCEAMNCAYLDLEGNGCIHQLIRDAIALLKAQEPVEPIPGLWDRDIQLYKCGACGGEIGAGGIAKYCFHCGRAVKWK